jgi:hypothetical protein
MSNEVRIKETFKGAPIINCTYYFCKSDRIHCICMDMETYYCEIIATGEGEHPSICLQATKYSNPIRKNTYIECPTEISFLDYNNDWSIFSANVNKDIIFITLIQKENI